MSEMIANYLIENAKNLPGRGRPGPGGGGGRGGAAVKRQGIKKCFQRHATQMTLLPCNSVASLYTWIERTTNSQLFFIEMKRSIVKETLHPLWLSCCRFLLSWRGTLYKRGGLLKLMTDLAQARGACFLAFYLQLWFLYKHSER